MEALTGRLRRRFQFYVGSDELSLLEAAVREHGSVQAAVLAALRLAAAEPAPQTSAAPGRDAPAASPFPRPERADGDDRGVERVGSEGLPPVRLYSRDAARVLGISTEAVRGRIERGALRGEQDATGHWIAEVDRDLVRSSGVELDPRGAALALGLRPGTVKARCKRGEYASARNEGTGWRIPARELLR